MLLDFFQLREQPFSVSPHPSYLYSSRSRSEAAESLACAAASPRSVFALLGAEGVGKTTLLNQSLTNVPASTRTILLPQANCSITDLVDSLWCEIGATPPGLASSPIGHRLHEVVSRKMRDGRNYLMIADNAEQLDAQVLEAICALGNRELGLSVILTGQPNLFDQLQRNPSPLSFATKILEPLSGPETAAYIQHRLRVAGHSGVGLFERESLALIAEHSQGISRSINQICFRCLLEGYASGCRTLSPDIVEKAAQKLASGETQQSVPSVQTPRSNTFLSSSPHGRLQPSNRVSLPVFLSQSLLRRAAVAAIAATTLVLPYLAAKRISGSTRPGEPVTPVASQTFSASAGSRSAEAALTRSDSSGNGPAPKLLSSPERSPISHSAMPANFHGPNPEAAGRNVATDGPEQEAKTAGARFSLARELGLKINRIAIDAGHGGYDTGTIGPSGLMEKDLCLDVALRLGRMVKESIPGAEVVYTRTDDRYISLEERTAIANDAQADIFISVHANSSDVRQIRGAETYYVSFAASPEAREVATRENAVGDSSLHNLPDLIKRITRNENLAESRQLASDIQNSLSERLQLVSRQETNRGVKRAPFIVLTGANMPAVLAEISFLSNPTDEKLLAENDQRQRVTDGLYRGIAAYLGTMASRSLPEHASGRTASDGSLIRADGLR